MTKKLLMSFVFLLCLIFGVSAQDRTISGKVTSSEDGSALPGVSVSVKGSTKGTTTGSDGTYKVSVGNNATLVFSFVGFRKETAPVGSRTVVDVVLVSDASELSEVVVTANGIERDKRSLSYSTQEVKGDQIAQKGEPNMLNALQGKVAGVQIVGASGEPGASTNINIRGIQSFTGSNQPLFVIDGIPVSNDLDRLNVGSLGSLGGPQSSNRAVDINPDNIESVNVLKGPAAAALYGSRAASGVIIITTKSGKGSKKKTEITFNSSLTLQDVYGLPDFQNEYGQGGSWVFNPQSTSSWGPSFSTVQKTGYTLYNGLLIRNATTPAKLDTAINANNGYKLYRDNIRNSFNQGTILQNSINFAGGDAKTNFNLSIANTSQKGIVKFSEFNRNNIAFSGNHTLANNVKIGGSLQYSNSTQRSSLTGNGGSAFGQLQAIPRSYDLQGLPYIDANGRSVFLGGVAGVENPLWSLEKNFTNGNTDRFTGNITVAYDVTKWLNISTRVGLDNYTDRRKQRFGVSSLRQPLGEIADFVAYRSQINSDLIITLKKDNLFESKINGTLRLGNNINARSSQFITANVENTLLPNFDNVAFGTVFSNGTTEFSEKRRLVGWYAQALFDYKNWAFLEFTGRADRSSTLPVANSSFFYPSISGSIVLTDAFKINSDILSYAKIRGNWAKVGKDADPYQIATYYRVLSQGNNVANLAFPVNGLGGFAIDTQLGAGETLRPEFTTSTEAGLNIGLLKNRVSIDATYYLTRHTDLITNVGLAATTGFTSRTINVGEMTNEGVEILLNITPLKIKDFKWEFTANLSKNVNKVVRVGGGVDRFNINGNSFIGTAPSIVEGYPYGVIVGGAKPRVGDVGFPVTGAEGNKYEGQIVINPNNGLWATPDIQNKILADPNPKGLIGITNTFSWKGLRLSALFDSQIGGQIVSFSTGFYKSRGMIVETGNQRELSRTINGVIPVRDASNTIIGYTPNNIQIDAQNYWGSMGLQSDLNVYDATVYRLREASFGYEFPSKLLAKTPFGSASINFVGRNLFFFAPYAIIDPEVNTQGAGNIRGLELQSAPNTRNYGVNVRLTF